MLDQTSIHTQVSPSEVSTHNSLEIAAEKHCCVVFLFIFAITDLEVPTLSAGNVRAPGNAVPRHHSEHIAAAFSRLSVRTAASASNSVSILQHGPERSIHSAKLLVEQYKDQ